MRMAAGHERHARGAAERKGAVRVFKSCSALRQFIEGRRVNDAVAGAAHHSLVMLVGHDEQNIGSLGHFSHPIRDSLWNITRYQNKEHTQSKSIPGRWNSATVIGRNPGSIP